MKQKVVSKGYTITVQSWENDGDNYRTQSIVVDTLKEAKAVYKLCTTVFEEIGNTMEVHNAKDIIVPFMKDHPELYEYNTNIKTDYDLVMHCMNKYNFGLMGGSEYYYSRVCESCTVTYSPEDIFAEVINF